MNHLASRIAAVLCAGASLLAQGETSSMPEGFVKGLQGFDHFHAPIGQPIYFETPLNTSEIRPIFLRHEFSPTSQLQGGDVTVYAVQARLAITERLGFIATKDGYSQLDIGDSVDEEGWNSLAGGFKYVALADKENDLIVTPGFRIEIENGSRDVLQGGVGEFSPFVSVAKGFDQLHAIANFTWRMPFDEDDGNQVMHYDLHLDYDVAPDSIKGFAPCIELHGVSYLTNGTALPLSVGGLDYTNLGSADVAGSFVAWAGIGARYEIPDTRMSFGAVYEFALTDKDKDIMDTRVTIDFIHRF